MTSWFTVVLWYGDVMISHTAFVAARYRGGWVREVLYEGWCERIDIKRWVGWGRGCLIYIGYIHLDITVEIYQNHVAVFKYLYKTNRFYDFDQGQYFPVSIIKPVSFVFIKRAPSNFHFVYTLLFTLICPRFDNSFLSLTSVIPLEYNWRQHFNDFSGRPGFISPAQ